MLRTTMPSRLRRLLPSYQQEPATARKNEKRVSLKKAESDSERTKITEYTRREGAYRDAKKATLEAEEQKIELKSCAQILKC